MSTPAERLTDMCALACALEEADLELQRRVGWLTANAILQISDRGAPCIPRDDEEIFHELNERVRLAFAEHTRRCNKALEDCKQTVAT
jgi:hypothetical protein